MKKLVVLPILFALMISFQISANGAQESEAKNEMEIFSWWTAGGEAEGLNAIIDIYQAQNPDVDLINATVAGGAGTNAKAVLATRMQGGDPPDSFQVHAGHELIDTWVVSDFMEPISYILKDNGWMDKFPKDVILEAPRTMEEFFNVAEVFASNGVTPLSLGDTGIWASTHLLENVILASTGPEKYNGLWDGSTSWDSPEVREALNNFAKMMKYVNADHSAISNMDAAQYVAEGKAAMNVMGDWAAGYFMSKGYDQKVVWDWVPSPGTEGNFIMLSDSFGLPKDIKNVENAEKWLTVLASKEGQDAFNPVKGSIPARIDGDRSLYNEYQNEAMDDFNTNVIVPSLAHGAAASEAWLTRINDIVTILVTKLDVDKAVEDLTSAAEKYAQK
ncbi:MAG: ABC transporter substrate-binding protein [Spirochaetaceae bacterium 4572_59]|nr:MAG: ABC transporter substrate-binding protein [Spirochaetaceae bacterium 4572_59]